MNLGPKHVQELGKPGGMRRPGRGGHQVAIHVGLINADVHVLPARARHVRPHGRVRRTALPLENTCRRQDLRAMTYGCEGLVRLGEVADDLQEILVQTDVLRRSATGDDQGVIGLGPYIGEGCVEGEVGMGDRNGRNGGLRCIRKILAALRQDPVPPGGRPRPPLGRLEHAGGLQAEERGHGAPGMPLQEDDKATEFIYFTLRLPLIRSRTKTARGEVLPPKGRVLRRRTGPGIPAPPVLPQGNPD